MFSILAAVAAATAATPASSEASAHLVRLSAGACYDLARSPAALPPPSDIPARDSLVKAFGMEPGLPARLSDRLGPHGSALVSKATTGSKSFGEDAIVLAFGGDIPGCSVALYSPSGESREYEIVAALVARGWKEPRPGLAQQRGFVGKRMAVMRDKDGRPFLANVLTLTHPASDLRHIVTVAAIPPHVILPDGF